MKNELYIYKVDSLLCRDIHTAWLFAIGWKKQYVPIITEEQLTEELEQNSIAAVILQNVKTKRTLNKPLFISKERVF